MELLSARMKIFPAASTIVVLLDLTRLLAAVPEDPGTADSLAEAEKAFAHESVAKGMKAAFLNALADDGLVFDPGPGAQNGKKVWLEKKESRAILDWQPVLAVVSSSGDLGYTTGPWNYRKSPNQKPEAFGEFVSVWRREGGKWKLLCDIGSDHPAPSAMPPELKLIDLPHPSESKPEQFSNLQHRDCDYAANRAGQFVTAAEEDVRLYLPGKFPILGKSAGAAALSAAPAAMKFGESKGGLSRSGDLGFLWGEYRIAAKETSGDYLRIWRKGEPGKWKLTLDLLHSR